MTKGMSKNKKSAVYRKTNGHCAYCGEWLDPFSPWTVDHVLTRIRGGTNNLDNLVLSCKRCNSAKCDRTDEEFKVYMNDRIIGHLKAAMELMDRFERSNKHEFFTAIREAAESVNRNQIVFHKDTLVNFCKDGELFHD